MLKYYQENNPNIVSDIDEHAYAWMKKAQALFALDNNKQIRKFFNSSEPQNFIRTWERLYSPEEIKKANEIAKKICYTYERSGI